MALRYTAHYNDGYNMMDGSDWGWGFLMMLFWAIVIIAIVVMLIRGLSSSQSNKKSRDEDSLDIAKNRYAKGEITKKEFEQLKKDLVSR
jgi:putative membrane protein